MSPCLTCQFFQKTNDWDNHNGVCVHMPVHVKVRLDHGCGQHKRA